MVTKKKNINQVFFNKLQSFAVPLASRHFEVVDGEIPLFVHHRQHVTLVAKEADVVDVVMDTWGPDQLPVAHVGLEAHPDARLAVRGAVCVLFKLCCVCGKKKKQKKWLVLLCDRLF